MRPIASSLSSSWLTRIPVEDHVLAHSGVCCQKDHSHRCHKRTAARNDAEPGHGMFEGRKPAYESRFGSVILHGAEERPNIADVAQFRERDIPADCAAF